MTDGPTTIEGALIAPEGARFAIVAARFNAFVVDSLLGGCIDGLVRHGAKRDRISVVRVPGAREISPICARLAKSNEFDAVIALGVVIRGATAHFDYVASEVSRGVAAAGDANVPVIFGVLTTDTIEQAVERAGTKAGNKGFDAALCAIEMLSLNRALTEAGI